MTSATQQAGAGTVADGEQDAVREPGPETDLPPGAPDDPFDQDLLPAPKNAQLALLRSLLRPHNRRVWLATVLLLVQQAAVQAGPLLVAYAIDRAIPQVRELIRMYHPDILWFDTPQKLPLSEQLRVVAAVREADPNVVIGGFLSHIFFTVPLALTVKRKLG